MPLDNGLYAIRFQTPLGAGAGVVYAQNGHLRGGDSGMAYIGTFQEDGDKLTADVRAFRHTANPGIRSVFGVDDVNIHLDGTATQSSATCIGTAPQAPGLRLQVTLERISD